MKVYIRIFSCYFKALLLIFAGSEVGVVYPNVAGKQPKKKKKGIAPNALDMKGGTLLPGGSLVKR